MLKTSSPDWVLLENVDAMDDGGDNSALNSVLAMLANLGYDTQGYRLCSSSYGLPQARIRLFLLGIRRPTRGLVCGDFDAFFKRMTETVIGFEVKGPSLPFIMLPAEHPWVKEELARRLQKGKPKGWDSSTLTAHRAAWHALGVRWQGQEEPQQDDESEWYPTLCCRQRDIIAYFQKKHAHSQEGKAKCVGIDVGQSITRIPHTTLSKAGCILAPTLLPHTALWMRGGHGQPGRLLTGYEAMLAQGWPLTHPTWARQVEEGTEGSAFYAGLAGNAFPGTTVMALVAALVFASEWQAPCEDKTDVLAACSLFESLGHREGGA